LKDLLHLFEINWAKKKFVVHGGRVLLAVSGGSDSMVMAELFRSAGISIGVAHCNFGLRGEASDLDEALVRDWCLTNQVVFHRVLFDTKERAVEWKKGTQETARILRYEWFEQLRVEFGYAKVATAHHADDNAETLLINLLRGTGISGLHGVKEVNGAIIRPLLFATKKMIGEYAGQHSIAYRDDASNATDDYLRNAIRHKLIPVASGLVPGAVDNINDSIARFAEAEVLYSKAIERERKRLIEKRGQDHYVPIRKLIKSEPLATLCYELLRPFNFTSGQTEQVVGLLTSTSGHYVSSGTHRVIRDRDFLVVTAVVAGGSDMVLVEGLPATVDTGRYVFHFSLKPRPDVIPPDPDEAWLDMKYIAFPIVLRKWKQGDHLYPLGMKMKKKKVSRILIDAKVSLHDKEEVSVLECDKRIAWLCGMRIDERFKLRPSSEQALVVKRIRK
jgi:tRNA(Ile)-lysidine synthase